METRTFNKSEIRGTLVMTVISFLLDDERVYTNEVLKNYLFGLYDGYDYSNEIEELGMKAFKGDIRMIRMLLDLCEAIQKIK